MTPIAEILARMLVILEVGKDAISALGCKDVAEGLREIYPDGQIPASEVILVEELFLIRITSVRLEGLLGTAGMFIRRGGETVAPMAHPALATTMKNRERYKKTWNNLAWRHGVAGLQPSREKALANAANHPTGVAANGAAKPGNHVHGATKQAVAKPIATTAQPLASPPVTRNVGPLVNPDVVSRIANGSGTVTREELLRAGKAAVAV